VHGTEIPRTRFGGRGLTPKSLGNQNYKKMFIKNKRSIENISGKKFMMYCHASQVRISQFFRASFMCSSFKDRLKAP